MSTQSLKILVTKKYCFTTKKTRHKTLQKLTKTALNMDLPRRKGLSSDSWFFIIFEGAMSIPGVVPIWCSISKIYENSKVSLLYTREVSQFAPLKNYHLKRKPDRLHKPIIFQGENDKNFGGVKSSAKNFCRNRIFFRIKPLHGIVTTLLIFGMQFP